MKEFECQVCGAIYLLNSTTVPASTMCTCKSRDFKLVGNANLVEAS